MSDDEMTPHSKRPRAANYTQQEKTLLLNIILKFKDVLESKKTDAISWREKENAWKQVADHFNSVSPAGLYRPVVSLKKAFENIKKNTRKDVANEKASIRCTGGGKGYFKSDPVLDLALEVINPKTVHGLENPFDSNKQQVIDSNEENFTNNLTGKKFENVTEKCGEESQNTDVETLIIQVENDENHNDVDWGDFTVKCLRQPINPKLLPKSKANQVERNEECSQETSSNMSTPLQQKSFNRDGKKLSWSARRRPITASLSSSDISKKYTKLADLKIELVQKELEKFETQSKVRDERDAVEFELKKKCLELDVKIKQAILEKITSSSNPLDFLSFQK